MNKLLNHLKTGLTVVFLFTSSNAFSNQVELINTEEGYPYKQLIKYSDKVNLIYKEGKRVSCRVVVHIRGRSIKGRIQEISNKQFRKKPMASCMNRDIAKAVLASIR